MCYSIATFGRANSKIDAKIVDNQAPSVLYHIAGYFRGESFCEFHKSSSIRENFILKMFLFSGYSTQSVMIHENFALEKLGRLNSWNFPPQK